MASKFDNYSKKGQNGDHDRLYLLRDSPNDSSDSGDLSAEELKEAADSVYIWQVLVKDPDAINRVERETRAALVRVPIAQLPALNGLLYDTLNRQQANLDRIAELEQLVRKDLGRTSEVKKLRDTVARLHVTISERNVVINQLERERWEREERELAWGQGRTGLKRLWGNISTVMTRMKSPKGAGSG